MLSIGECQGSTKEYKIVVMSDTHGNVEHLNKTLSGDIFIHAGDFTHYCTSPHVHAFLNYLDTLKFRYKIVTCGNNQLHFDKNTAELARVTLKDENACKQSPEQLKALLKEHCIYLQHQMIEIEGIRIFGSPCARKHGASAFAYEQQDAKHVWDIPNVDILITHSPPYGILDIGYQINVHLGCKQLRQRVEKMKPKIHIFGHIHESYGKQQVDETLFMNAAQCGAQRKMKNTPFTIMYKHPCKTGQTEPKQKY